VPTYTRAQRFDSDWHKLTEDQQNRFRIAVRQFVADLEGGGRFRPGLRVKGVSGAPGVFEMTWAPDGRATWQYGQELVAGQPHVIWRRIGTHRVLANP
jgi:hypothetical protein